MKQTCSFIPAISKSLYRLIYGSQ